MCQTKRWNEDKGNWFLNSMNQMWTGQRLTSKQLRAIPVLKAKSLKLQFFWLKKHSFLSRISTNYLFWPDLPQKTQNKKFYFWQNLLENFNFCVFFTISLLWCKKNSVLSRILTNHLYLASFAEKTHKIKISIFLTKTMDY